MGELSNSTSTDSIPNMFFKKTTMQEFSEVLSLFERSLAEYQPETTSLFKPLTIAAWEAVTDWEFEQQTWMAHDKRLFCIVSTSEIAPPPGDRAIYICSFPRPDELFEHIYLWPGSLHGNVRGAECV